MVTAAQQESLDKTNSLTWAAGAFSALGSLVTGASAYSTALGRAAVYSSNAAVIRAAIPQTQKAGEQQVDAIRADTASLISNQRAALAANGIVVDSDTGLDALVQAAGAGARDVMTSINNTRAEIAKLQNQANQADYEAKLSKRAGQASLLQGIGNAGISILGSASTVSQNNLKYGATK